MGLRPSADSAVLLYLLLNIECQDQLLGFLLGSLDREMGCAVALSQQSDSKLASKTHSLVFG